MNNKKREISLIFGKTGSGKTELAKKIIEDQTRLIIIDAMEEYEQGLIFYSFDDLIDFFIDNGPEKFKIICRFSTDEEIDFLFKLVFAIGNIFLVVEEAEIYISPFAKSSEFLKLVRYGRHKSISILGIARRTAELSTDFKAQVNTIYSFKQTLPLDILNMEKLGFSGIENLPEFEYKTLSF